MALQPDAQNFIAELVTQLVPQLSPNIQGMVQQSCAAILARSGSMPPATGGGSFPVPVNTYPGSQLPLPAGCPVSPASVGFPGCPVNCDECLFPQLDTDLRLYGFPLVESELWDQQTSIVADPTDLPLAPGGTLTAVQEARRTLSWIPGIVSIATTWSGGDPQPGLLTYQWAMSAKGAIGPSPVQFGAPMNGQQFECGQSCLKVPFPKYKGCDGVMVGALAQLELIVTLSPAATSTLESIMIVVYHKQNKKACCGGCAAGGACSC